MNALKRVDREFEMTVDKVGDLPLGLRAACGRADCSAAEGLPLRKELGSICAGSETDTPGWR